MQRLSPGRAQDPESDSEEGLGHCYYDRILLVVSATLHVSYVYDRILVVVRATLHVSHVYYCRSYRKAVRCFVLLEPT